jgi:hypothetical protein
MIRALLSGALLLFSLSAVGVESGDDLTAYREASSKFAALVAGAELGKKQQQLQTKEVSLLISLLSDEKRFLRSQPYAVKDLGNLLELCGMANKAVMSLALFDLKAHVDPKGDPKTVAGQVVVLMQKNSETFWPQLRHLHPFLIKCMAKEVPPMTEFTVSLTPEQFTEVRRKGLEQARTGLVELFVGVLQSVGNPNYDERYRAALVQALAESAPSLASALPISARRQIRSIADAAGKSSPPIFGTYLETIRRTLDDTTCKGLCAL